MRPHHVPAPDCSLSSVLCSPATTAQTRTASPTPFSACSPRSSNRTPADVRASERTVSETSTSPEAESPLALRGFTRFGRAYLLPRFFWGHDSFCTAHLYRLWASSRSPQKGDGKAPVGK